jgi:hypothetical protein
MALTSDVARPDARVQSILTDLEKLKLEEFNNRTFVDTDVYLDGRAFTDCFFKNCRFFVKLGNFRIGGKSLHLENIEWILSGSAQGIKAIADLIYLGQVQEVSKVHRVRQQKK